MGIDGTVTLLNMILSIVMGGYGHRGGSSGGGGGVLGGGGGTP